MTHQNFRLEAVGFQMHTLLARETQTLFADMLIKT